MFKFNKDQLLKREIQAFLRQLSLVTRMHHGDEWLMMLEYFSRRVPARWMGQMSQVVRVCPAECTVDHCRCQRPRRRRSIISVAPFCCRAENQQAVRWRGGGLGWQDRRRWAIKSDWTVDEQPSQPCCKSDGFSPTQAWLSVRTETAPLKHKRRICGQFPLFAWVLSHLIWRSPIERFLLDCWSSSKM